MVEAEVLRRRVDALVGYLSRLQAFTAIDRDEFVREPDRHHLAERYLHLAIESALDIVHHVIAARGLESPDTYRDAFAILGRSGEIDPGLAKRLQGWAGMRNVLVHAYLDVDHGLVWDAIANELDDLRELAAVTARWL